MSTGHAGQHRYLSSKLMVGVCLLFVVLLMAGIWRVFLKQSTVSKALLSFNSAYSQQRPLESRISSLAYAPFSTRGERVEAGDEAALRRAELSLLEAVANDATPAAHHALGQVYLAQQRVDEAVLEFEKSLKTEPKNAMVLSDLGAAWLERGKLYLRAHDEPTSDQGKAMQAFAASLGYLDQALSENDNSRESLFNRALCLAYLHLPVRAQEEWREYLKRDSESGWAQEAKHTLALLEQQGNSSSATKERILNDFFTAYANADEETAWTLISKSRDDLSGTSVSQQLFDAYLNSAIAGETDDAARQLRALSYLGELEASRAGEHYNVDLVRLSTSLTLAQKRMISKARELMRTGYKLYEQSAKTDDMLTVFQQAAGTFAQAGDTVEVHHARFWIAYCSTGALSTQQRLALLTKLAADCGKFRYRWLLMRTVQSISSAKYSLKDYSEAIDYSLQALDLSRQIGDQIGSFNALDTLTEIYRAINNYDQAISSVGQSQALIDCCAFNQIKVWRHYGIVAFAFYSSGSYAAAVEYQREAVRRALAANDPEMISVSYVHLGLMLAKLGNYEEGLKNAKSGYETATTVTADARRNGLTAYTLLQMAHLQREMGDCDDALKDYDNSLTLYEDQKSFTHIYQAHKGRLLCYLKQGKDAQARDELRTTLQLLDDNRSTIFEDDNRVRFFDVEQSIYDLGTDYAYTILKDPQAAFTYTEDSRARSLLDLMLKGNLKPGNDGLSNEAFHSLSVTQIQQSLSEVNQIVEYTVLDEKTLIWVIDKNHELQVRESGISRVELEGRVTRYLNLISDYRSSAADLEQHGRDLFNVLIGPVETLLDSQKQLNIVPDKILNLLPFGALISANSGRFLIEDYSLSYAPSSSIFAISSVTVKNPVSEGTERILAVGNPTFDPQQYSFLPDLKDAEREAREVRHFYDRGRVLVENGATKRNILQEMINSDVVHLALHSINEPQAEMRSRLILAKEANESDGVLDAAEIDQLRLPHTRLVVLSACQTGAGKYYQGEGTLSLARAFLVAGVPTVIASLWPVDSEATAELMIDFHRLRKDPGVSTAEALKRAQLEMLRSTEPRFHHPYYWAAFSVFGGYQKYSVDTPNMN